MTNDNILDRTRNNKCGPFYLNHMQIRYMDGEMLPKKSHEIINIREEQRTEFRTV